MASTQTTNSRRRRNESSYQYASLSPGRAARRRGGLSRHLLHPPGRSWTGEQSPPPPAAEVLDTATDESPPAPREARLVLYSPHPAQAILHASPARFRLATCGRRFGKTLAAVNELAGRSWEKPGAVSWWVAPTYALTQVGYRMLTSAFRTVIRDCSESEKRIEWMNGSVSQFRSADNWKALVGEGLDFLVVDEAGRVDERAWLESLRPTLSDKLGKALIIGTPKGKNWFYEEWTRGKDPAFPEYESWQMPTTNNPFVPATEVDHARRTLPDSVFSQEYLAKFLDRNAGVFRNVDKCIRDYSVPVEPVSDELYFGGLDLARLQDFTVIIIIDGKGRVVYFDRWQHASWEVQIEMVCDVINKYGASVYVDSTGVGDPILERLASTGIDVMSYKFTNESKKQLIERLMISFERELITIPTLSELINELDIFEYEIAAGGIVKYSAPDGYHDDCVISLALANLAYTELGSTRPVGGWL